jgi:hypothetical protein
MDAYSRSVVQIELFGDLNGELVACGFGTGFFYKPAQELFLVTNWHVVTGIDPTTMVQIDPSSPLPRVMRFQFKQTVDANGHPVPSGGAPIIVGNFSKVINLYEARAAVWYEHSTRANVDVVALPLSQDELGEFANIPVNLVDQSPALIPTPGMDCFVLGYPEGMVGPGLTPIWKRASIASEPNYNYRNKPAFLIDTATRNGMSGSPVIARHSGILKVSQGPLPGPEDIIGTVTKFVGVYSGRIGDDPMEVQLGMVWRSEVLGDILSKNTPGR